MSLLTSVALMVIAGVYLAASIAGYGTPEYRAGVAGIAIGAVAWLVALAALSLKLARLRRGERTVASPYGDGLDVVTVLLIITDYFVAFVSGRL
ncbi:MAG: hypothetical protein ACR2IP_07785 [Solirubrobacteraceae bacterium]